jgi:hypothetical protein
MKSRFETENGCDFETLDAEQRLAAARRFAAVAPLMLEEFFRLSDLIHVTSVEAQSRFNAAPDIEAARAVGTEYAGIIGELTNAFTALMTQAALNLGHELGEIGLRSASATPTTTTRQ